MRTIIIGCFFTVFGLLAQGQPAAQTSQEQVFRFSHALTTQSASEMAVAIRTVTEMSAVNVSNDNPPSTLTVRGTPEQVALASWLFVELDQPAGPPSKAATGEFKLSGGADNIVRVFYVTNAENVQQFQEIATAIRTVVEIRRIFTYNQTRAMVARGTADQLKLTEWLMPLMDKPLHQTAQHAASPLGAIPDSKGESATQVFYVGNSPTVQSFQELATTIRTVTQIRRVFTYNDGRAMVVRGLDSQLEMAAWLFNELDQPAGAQGTNGREYQAPGNDDVVRVFYFTRGGNPQGVRDVVNQIQASTKVQRAFSNGSRAGIILRGTAAQMASAARMVQELDKP